MFIVAVLVVSWEASRHKYRVGNTLYGSVLLKEDIFQYLKSLKREIKVYVLLYYILKEDGHIYFLKDKKHSDLLIILSHAST
jgi:hypothetical protein